MILFSNLLLLFLLIFFALWVRKNKNSNLTSLLITVFGTFCGVLWSLQAGLYFEELKDQKRLVFYLDEVVRLSPRNSFIYDYYYESWNEESEDERDTLDDEGGSRSFYKLLGYGTLESASLMHFKGSDLWFFDRFVQPSSDDKIRIESLKQAKLSATDDLVERQSNKLSKWILQINDLRLISEYSVASSNAFRRSLEEKLLELDEVSKEFYNLDSSKEALLPIYQLQLARLIGDIEQLITLEVLRIEWKILPWTYVNCRVERYELDEYLEECFEVISSRKASRFEE